MAEYFTTDEAIITPGIYQLVYQSAGGAGTGQLEISKDNGISYQVMTDGTFTTSEDRTAYLGGAKYKFTLTGDARIWIDKIK